MFSNLWKIIKKYVNLYLAMCGKTSEPIPNSDPHKEELALLRNPVDVALPEGWNPGWNLKVQGTAVVIDPANGKEYTGKIKSIESTECFSLKSKNALLEYGVHPTGNYDQFAVRVGPGDKGPGGSMLVMVAMNPKTKKLIYGTIDETRPLSVFEKADGTVIPLVMRTPPGGFVDPNEDASRAAVRETKEECGISLENPLYVGSIVDNRAFFTSRFYEDGRPADAAVAVYTIEVEFKKLVEREDGSYIFPQLTEIPDTLKKSKTLQCVFRNKAQSCDTADGLAISAISKTQDYYDLD